MRVANGTFGSSGFYRFALIRETPWAPTWDQDGYYTYDDGAPLAADGGGAGDSDGAPTSGGADTDGGVRRGCNCHSDGAGGLATLLGLLLFGVIRLRRSRQAASSI